MARVRRNPSREVETLEKQQASIEREINKCAVFAEGVKTHFWKEVESRYQNSMNEIEDKLDLSYEKESVEMVHFHLGRRVEIKKILAIRDFAKKRSDLMARHAHLEKQIRKIKRGGG